MFKDDERARRRNRYLWAARLRSIKQLLDTMSRSGSGNDRAESMIIRGCLRTLRGWTRSSPDGAGIAVLSVYIAEMACLRSVRRRGAEVVNFQRIATASARYERIRRVYAEQLAKHGKSTLAREQAADIAKCSAATVRRALARDSATR